jgi:membrane-associated phospholipid phosphatase
MAPATSVAHTRIHTGVHYPSDVIAGGLAGAGIGSLVSILTGRATAGSITKTGPARAPLRALPGCRRHHRKQQINE